ncbi:hypothetical protein DFR86_10805 [Acidianus sulfidivorans JP7]|uniref:Uncharacterized protein n=1 Tax=Acidianus sulfidivorans JP7 TaxID=619593 RepID=A0A2U9IQP0_9CREN|nr:hypothetical protein [Acidianus sulfidivorans]AWR98342.1 hypothetical protein DFR86_10805 [Acidianus sulfidivorans JP7]
MLSDKEVVLSAVETLGKWDIMLAGIKDNELLMVIKRRDNDVSKSYPDTLEVDGRTFNVKYYDSEEYFNLLRSDETIFRKYNIVYFVKVYMRKVLDTLAYLEVEKLSNEFRSTDSF